MPQLDTYHRKRTFSLDSSIVQSIPVTPVVLSSLSPNAIPFCPRAEVSQKKEVAIDWLSKGSSVHGYVTQDEPVSFQKTGCDADMEASLKMGYLELNFILGASTSALLD